MCVVVEIFFGGVEEVKREPEVGRVDSFVTKWEEVVHI